ncbi:ABC transporter ATP-binding protein [Myxococcota bacterium]|nr:ABC transporter ATP-binding protein [Myxococcota bacterium]
MISVRGFKKTFYVGFWRKRVEAVRDISFEVEPKEIFGFLGPNGAGKTTTIKALLGLIRPDGGALSLCGHPVESFAWRSLVGYMPEHPNFYEYLSAHEMVVWFGRLAGLTRHEAEARAKRTLERVGLAHAMNRRLRSYSKGQLQRAGLAQALIASPKLLILDEPMTGLDPIGRKDIRELILELRDEGCTIFYSTHILPDVEMTCDRVSICHRGETRRTGRLEDILTETTRGVSVTVSRVPSAAISTLRTAHPGATQAGDTLQVLFPDAAAAHVFLAEATALGAVLERFEPHRDNLEDIFVRALGGADASALGPVVTGRVS